MSAPGCKPLSLVLPRYEMVNGEVERIPPLTKAQEFQRYLANNARVQANMRAIVPKPAGTRIDPSSHNMPAYNFGDPSIAHLNLTASPIPPNPAVEGNMKALRDMAAWAALKNDAYLLFAFNRAQAAGDMTMANQFQALLQQSQQARQPAPVGNPPGGRQFQLPIESDLGAYKRTVINPVISVAGGFGLAAQPHIADARPRPGENDGVAQQVAEGHQTGPNVLMPPAVQPAGSSPILPIHQMVAEEHGESKELMEARMNTLAQVTNVPGMFDSSAPLPDFLQAPPSQSVDANLAEGGQDLGDQRLGAREQTLQGIRNAGHAVKNFVGNILSKSPYEAEYDHPPEEGEEQKTSPPDAYDTELQRRFDALAADMQSDAQTSMNIAQEEIRVVDTALLRAPPSMEEIAAIPAHEELSKKDFMEIALEASIQQYKSVHGKRPTTREVYAMEKTLEEEYHRRYGMKKKKRGRESADRRMTRENVHRMWEEAKTRSGQSYQAARQEMEEYVRQNPPPTQQSSPASEEHMEPESVRRGAPPAPTQQWWKRLLLKAVEISLQHFWAIEAHVIAIVLAWYFELSWEKIVALKTFLRYPRESIDAGKKIINWTDATLDFISSKTDIPKSVLYHIGEVLSEINVEDVKTNLTHYADVATERASTLGSVIKLTTEQIVNATMALPAQATAAAFAIPEAVVQTPIVQDTAQWAHDFGATIQQKLNDIQRRQKLAESRAEYQHFENHASSYAAAQGALHGYEPDVMKPIGQYQSTMADAPQGWGQMATNLLHSGAQLLGWSAGGQGIKRRFSGRGVDELPEVKRRPGHPRGPVRDDIPFGIFLIDKLQLHHGILSIVRASNRKKIANLPNRPISTAFRGALSDCLNGINPDTTTLTHAEQLFLSELVRRAKVTHVHVGRGFANHNSKSSGHDDSLKELLPLQHQLTLNLGELDSGNNSDLLKRDTALIQETLHILRTLHKQKKLSFAEVADIIKQFHLEEDKLYH